MGSRTERRRYGITARESRQREAKRQRLAEAVANGGPYAMDARRELGKMAVHDYTEKRNLGGRALTARAKGKTDVQTCKYFAAKRGLQLPNRSK